MSTTTSQSTVQTKRYAAGEGYEAGNQAPADLYLDTETDKIVKSAPERGQIVTIKGAQVEPWAARLLESKKFKG